MSSMRADCRIYAIVDRPSCSEAVDSAGRDECVMIPMDKLEAEQKQCQEQCQEDLSDTNQRPSRRRPRAGCYPLGYSPYRMDQKRSTVQLDRRMIKEDFRVRDLSRVIVCCN